MAKPKDKNAVVSKTDGVGVNDNVVLGVNKDVLDVLNRPLGHAAIGAKEFDNVVLSKDDSSEGADAIVGHVDNVEDIDGGLKIDFNRAPEDQLAILDDQGQEAEIEMKISSVVPDEFIKIEDCEVITEHFLLEKMSFDKLARFVDLLCKTAERLGKHNVAAELNLLNASLGQASVKMQALTSEAHAFASDEYAHPTIHSTRRMVK